MSASLLKSLVTEERPGTGQICHRQIIVSISDLSKPLGLAGYGYYGDFRPRRNRNIVGQSACGPQGRLQTDMGSVDPHLPVLHFPVAKTGQKNVGQKYRSGRYEWTDDEILR
jgi:hypothetical protein